MWLIHGKKMVMKFSWAASFVENLFFVHFSNSNNRGYKNQQNFNKIGNVCKKFMKNLKKKKDYDKKKNYF